MYVWLFLYGLFLFFYLFFFIRLFICLNFQLNDFLVLFYLRFLPRIHQPCINLKWDLKRTMEWERFLEKEKCGLLAKRNIWLWAGRLQKDKRRKQREKVRRERELGSRRGREKICFGMRNFQRKKEGVIFFLSGGKRIFSEEILKERVWKERGKGAYILSP